jgi:hypothetical protein
MLLIICLLRSPANPEISCGMSAFISISNLICTRINSAFALISGMSNSAASGGNLLSIPSIVLGLRPAPSLKPPRPGPNFTNLSANNKTSFVIPHPGHYSPARNPSSSPCRSSFSFSLAAPATCPLRHYKVVAEFSRRISPSIFA